MVQIWESQLLQIPNTNDSSAQKNSNLKANLSE